MKIKERNKKKRPAIKNLKNRIVSNEISLNKLVTITGIRLHNKLAPIKLKMYLFCTIWTYRENMINYS